MDRPSSDTVKDSSFVIVSGSLEVRHCVVPVAGIVLDSIDPSQCFDQITTDPAAAQGTMPSLRLTASSLPQASRTIVGGRPKQVCSPISVRLSRTRVGRVRMTTNCINTTRHRARLSTAFARARSRLLIRRTYARLRRCSAGMQAAPEANRAHLPTVDVGGPTTSPIMSRLPALASVEHVHWLLSGKQLIQAIDWRAAPLLTAWRMATWLSEILILQEANLSIYRIRLLFRNPLCFGSHVGDLQNIASWDHNADNGWLTPCAGEYVICCCVESVINASVNNLVSLSSRITMAHFTRLYTWTHTPSSPVDRTTCEWWVRAPSCATVRLRSELMLALPAA